MQRLEAVAESRGFTSVSLMVDELIADHLLHMPEMILDSGTVGIRVNLAPDEIRVLRKFAFEKKLRIGEVLKQAALLCATSNNPA